MIILDSTKVPYIIVIDTATGERYKIKFTPWEDRAEFNMDILGAHNGCFTDNTVIENSEVIIP